MSSVKNDDLYKSEAIYEEKKKLNQHPVKNNEINIIRQKLRDIQPAQGLSSNLAKNTISKKDGGDRPVKKDIDCKKSILNRPKDVKW